MSASIGSFNIPSEDHDLFPSPSMTTITNIESNTEGIIGPDHVKEILSAVYAVEATSPSGIKPTDLSKLCITSETLVEGSVERNTQLIRNKYEFFCLDTSQ